MQTPVGAEAGQTVSATGRRCASTGRRNHFGIITRSAPPGRYSSDQRGLLGVGRLWTLVACRHLVTLYYRLIIISLGGAATVVCFQVDNGWSAPTLGTNNIAAVWFGGIHAVFDNRH